MKSYRIRNWSQSNKSLIQRGSIKFWFSEQSIKEWKSTNHTGKKGRPREYSDDAILCALLIRTVYRLSLRAVEGMLRSLAELLKLDIKTPSYTQICRRAKDLKKAVKRLSKKRPTEIVFD